MNVRDYSPITWAFERFFHWLRILPPQYFMHRFVGVRSKLEPGHVASEEETAARSRLVEQFLVAYFVLDVAAFAATFSQCSLLIVLASVWAVLRIIDIIQATINVALFDYLRGRYDSMVASKTRLAILGILNYFELIICFSVIYGTCAENLIIVAKHLQESMPPWNALYFSALTQLTISFGDVTPRGFLRAVAVFQAITGLVFIVLIFARVFSALPPIKEVMSVDHHEDA